jgi:hypothetical protein
MRVDVADRQPTGVIGLYCVGDRRPLASLAAAGDGAGRGRGRGLAAVLSARQMILDIIGYLLAAGRLLKHLILDDRMVGFRHIILAV